MDDASNIVPPDVIVAGGQVLTVKKKGKDGASEEVLVKLVPISQLTKYASLIDHIAPLAEFLCGKEAGWADTLDENSVYQIDEVGRYINDPRLDRLIARQVKAVAKLGPTLDRASHLISSAAP